MSRTAGDGVTGFRLVDMAVANAGGECVRLRYLVSGALLEGNDIGPCGVFDFRFGGGGKNGEGVYVGTAPEQRGRNGAPDDRADVSTGNVVRGNAIDTAGNECVDIEEDSRDNLVESNTCTGQLDPNSGGMDARGNDNTFRANSITGNTGAGIRFGGDAPEDGRGNSAQDNTITGNAAGGIKFQAGPQGAVCGNVMSDNAGGDSVGTYGREYEPGRSC